MLQRRSLRFVQALLRCYWLLVCFNAPITDCFCGPCNRDNCVALNSTVCPYGTVFDGCCCMMCAKGPGEECGGIKLELCATGSRCMLEIEFGLFYSEYIQSRGICKLNPQPTSTVSQPATISRSTTATLLATSTYSTSVSLPVTLSAVSLPVTLSHSTVSPSSISSYSSAVSAPGCSTVLTSPTPTPVPRPICRTPCNADFCSDGRNRFCSATGIEFNSIVERGYCQRTTCKACRLHVSPDCPTCPDPVNKSCLRKFYLCINMHYQRTDITLELSDPRARSARGKVICHVPEMPAGNSVTVQSS